MPDLLDRIHDEIRARLRASEAAAREYERLEAALAALSGDAVATASGAPTAKRGWVSQERRTTPRPARRTRRAQRGANRAAALRAIGEHPGTGVAELIEATGIGRGVLYNVLGRLTEQGEIVKRSLPGGRTGYARGGEGGWERRGAGPRARRKGAASAAPAARARAPPGEGDSASDSAAPAATTAPRESSPAGAAPAARL